MKKIRVVIAEDDDQIAEIQRRFLERIDGFELVGIANGLEEAEDLVEVLKPELLLLDVQFPTGTGLDLLRRLRGGNSTTDVILITAAKEVETLKEALRGGVFDYILKPLKFARLQEALYSFANHLEKLGAMNSVVQTDVDTLLPRESDFSTAHKQVSQQLPKGVDRVTLDSVREVFKASAESSNTDDVAESIGVSRSTARRYLEYLVSIEELDIQLCYGSVGRPERRYILR